MTTTTTPELTVSDLLSRSRGALSSAAIPAPSAHSSPMHRRHLAECSRLYTALASIWTTWPSIPAAEIQMIADLIPRGKSHPGDDSAALLDVVRAHLERIKVGAEYEARTARLDAMPLAPPRPTRRRVWSRWFAHGRGGAVTTRPSEPPKSGVFGA